MLLIHQADFAQEGGIDRPMIGEEERSCIVTDLSEIVTFTEDSVAPCGNALLLGGIVGIGSDVELVGWVESNPSFIIERKGISSAHLELKLVVMVECFEVTIRNKLSCFLVSQSNAVIEVAEPDYCVMVVN